MTVAALPVLAALVLTILGVGRAAGHVVGHQGDPLTRLLSWLALGMFGTSLAVLALGHLALLRPVPIWMLLTAGVLSAAAQRDALVGGLQAAAQAVRPQSGFGRTALGIVVLMSVMLAASALRAPRRVDELEYHWASPLFWARQHRWGDSPFKLSDSFAMTEILYTVGAVSGGYVVAHMTHVLFFGVLLLATACAARAVGAPTGVSVAAVASMPVVLNQAAVSYNDVAAAAYAVSAVALLLQAPATARRLLVVGVVAAAAISTKLYCIALGPALVGALLVRHIARGERRWRSLAEQVGVIAAPMLGAGAFWAVRSKLLTGTFYDRTGTYLASSPSDPMLLTGQASGRIPTLTNLAELPFVPFVTAVIGQSEPYGGRTGLALIILLPALVLVLVVGGTAFRSRCWPLLVPGTIWFLLVAPFLIKTRFNITAFVLFTIAGAAAFAWLIERARPQLRHLMQAGYLVVVAVSALADSGRVLIGLTA